MSEERRCPICEKRLTQFEEHNIAHCAELLGLRVAELRSELRKWQTGAIVGIEFVPMMIDALEKERDALRAENTRLRERVRELIEQCDRNYEPIRKQLDEQALEQAATEYAYAVEIERLDAEVTRLREALERFAKIDLTGSIGDAIAWDILNARAVLKGDQE